MKRCPRCFCEPMWKYNHRSSLARKTGIQSLICFCAHCQPFSRRAQFVLRDASKYWETRWGLFVGKLFREHTASWPMPKRIHFWKRVCDPTRAAYSLNGIEPPRWNVGREMTQMELAENATIDGYDNEAKPSTQLFQF